MDGFPPAFRIFNDDCINLDHREPHYLFDLIYMEPPHDHLGLGTFAERLEVMYSRLHDNGFLLIHTSKYSSFSVKHQTDALGLPFKGDIIWTYRQRSVKSRALQNHHDTILVYSANPSYHAKRILIAHSVLSPSSAERTGYVGQKPIELTKKIVQRLDAYHRIDRVLDPYMGGGSVLVAALELGRSFVGFDICAEACASTEKSLLRSLPISRQMTMEFE